MSIFSLHRNGLNPTNKKCGWRQKTKIIFFLKKELFNKNISGVTKSFVRLNDIKCIEKIAHCFHLL